MASIWDILTYGKERAGQGMDAAKQNSSSVAKPPYVVAPIPPMPISNVATEAVNSGSRAATQAQNEQSQLGLFGNAMSKMFDSPVIGTAVDRLLELAMRPEAQQAQFGDRWFSPLTRAAAGQRLEERAAEQQQQDFMKQIILAQAKAKPEQLTGETTQLLDRIAANRQAIGFMNQMKKLAELGQVGGPNKVLDAMKTWFRPLGIDVPETATEEYKTRIANYIANLQQQKAFGTELSKSDYDLLEKILSNPGLFTSPTQLMSQINPIVDRLTTTQQDLLKRADYFGLGQLSGEPSRLKINSNTPVNK